MKIPLSSIDFQFEDVQHWKITFGRNIAEKQEQSWSHDILPDDHMRVSSYTEVRGLRGLRIGEPYKFTPYLYGGVQKEEISKDEEQSEKMGFDLRYQPNPITKILFTANPDFAQLESDAEEINVSDDPSQYPERRPFFTTNSEFYGPAPGVRTRNIGEIDAGLKFIQDRGAFKYDLTYVRALDTESNPEDWTLGHFIYDNGSSFLSGLVGGIRSTEDRTYINGVWNFQYRMMNRRLTAYNFLEYNSVVAESFGSLGGLEYRDRDYFVGLSYNYKPENYNTANVGYYLESNKMNLNTNLRYTYFFDRNDAKIRNLRFGLDLDRFALASDPDEDFYNVKFRFSTELRPMRLTGNVNISVNYVPDVGQKFRYRNEDGSFKDSNFFTTYNTFDLIEQKRDDLFAYISTDRSKMLAVAFWYRNRPVRQAEGEFYEATLVFKPIDALRMEYNYQHVNLGASPYQIELEEDIHRFKATYSITDRFNVRVIYSLDDLVLPEYDTDGDFNSENPVFNVTASWEYEYGSFAYLVFNRDVYREGYGTPGDVSLSNSVILKINKSFQF